LGSFRQVLEFLYSNTDAWFSALETDRNFAGRSDVVLLLRLRDVFPEWLDVKLLKLVLGIDYLVHIRRWLLDVVGDLFQWLGFVLVIWYKLNHQ